jgi:hypothetical protein
MDMGISIEGIRAFFEKRGIQISEVIKVDFIVVTSQPKEVHDIWSALPEPTQLYIIEEVQAKKSLLKRLQFWSK